jgi:hypothetical protein
MNVPSNVYHRLKMCWICEKFKLNAPRLEKIEGWEKGRRIGK